MYVIVQSVNKTVELFINKKIYWYLCRWPSNYYINSVAENTWWRVGIICFPSLCKLDFKKKKGILENISFIVLTLNSLPCIVLWSVVLLSVKSVSFILYSFGCAYHRALIFFFSAVIFIYQAMYLSISCGFSLSLLHFHLSFYNYLFLYIYLSTICQSIYLLRAVDFKDTSGDSFTAINYMLALPHRCETHRNAFSVCMSWTLSRTGRVVMWITEIVMPIAIYIPGTLNEDRY